MSNRKGSRRKSPTTALTAFLYEHNLSTYSIQKIGIMNAGYVYNASKKNVENYSIRFLKRLGRAVHMKWYAVGEALMRLQKIFPPKIAVDHRHGQGINANKGKHTRNKANK